MLTVLSIILHSRVLQKCFREVYFLHVWLLPAKQSAVSHYNYCCCCCCCDCLQGETAPVAVLGRGSDDDQDEQGYSSADDHDNSSDDDRPAAAAYSSDDEPAGPAEPDAAYLGMARKPAAVAAGKHQQWSKQQPQQQQPVAKQKAVAVINKQPQSTGKQALSLAEQEALALQLLSSQPW